MRKLFLALKQNNYLLNDQFTADLAAGAVNGTLATPGPGVRAVTDANSKLSITGGVLSFATGGVGAGDPRMDYGVMTRAAGKMGLGRIIMPTISSRSCIGFSTSVAGAFTEGLEFPAGTGMNVRVGNAQIGVGVYAAATYDIAQVLRSTGMYSFIKGDVFTNWTLLWMSSTVTGNVYFGIGSDSGAAVVLTADNFRIPVPTWLPVPTAYDTFTRANGGMGISETTGPDGQGAPTLAWTDQVGTWAITSNKAGPSVLAGAVGITTVNAGVADVLIDADLTQTLLNSGIVVRYVDSSNYVIAYHNGTSAKLDKVVGGSTSSIISATATYSANAVIRVICQGTSFQLFYNSAKVGSTSTVADAILQSATLHGLYSSGLGNTMDNFTVFSRGVDNSYSALDGY